MYFANPKDKAISFLFETHQLGYLLKRLFNFYQIYFA